MEFIASCRLEHLAPAASVTLAMCPGEASRLGTTTKALIDQASTIPGATPTNR